MSSASASGGRYLDKGQWPSLLMRLIDAEEWDSVMKRLQTHPEEAMLRDFHGWMCLHFACRRYAPLHVVKAVIQAAPEAAMIQSSHGYSPLHLAIDNASEQVQLALLQVAPSSVAIANRCGCTSMQDLAQRRFREGSLQVLRTMVEASPETVSLKDRQGFTPFQILTCRQYVDAITLGDLEEDPAWQAALICLQASCPNETSVVHMAAATPECPQTLWKVICRLFPSQRAVEYNQQGLTPLLLVAQNPLLEEVNLFGHVLEKICMFPQLVQWNPQAARKADAEGRLPLAHAIVTGKAWQDGTQDLLKAAPQVLDTRDTITHLYPYQLAAMYSEDLDTIYSLLRGLPEHLGRVLSAAQSPVNPTTTGVGLSHHDDRLARIHPVTHLASPGMTE